MVDEERLVILYGSQTGQAKAIAEDIFERFNLELKSQLDNKLNIYLYSLDLTEQRFNIETENTVVIVVSTTGEGDPPDNAVKFWRRIKKRTLPTKTYLKHLSYTLLALGDSNYDRFANFGHDLERRLEILGAKQFYKTGFGDDAVGLEIGVEFWLEELISNVLHHYGAFSICSVPKTVTVDIMAKIMPSQTTLLASSSPILTGRTELTLPNVPAKINTISIDQCNAIKNDDQFFFQTLPTMESGLLNGFIKELKLLSHHGKDVQETDKIILEAIVTFESDTQILYEPGDSFGFICGNSDEEVDELLKLLNLSEVANNSFTVSCSGLEHFPESASVRNLLKYYAEIRSVLKKNCLRHLADFCSDLTEKRRLYELSSREGSEEYNTIIRKNNLNILDILKSFKSCKPTLKCVLIHLPCFTPRYYSVVWSAMNMAANCFKIVFSVVQFDSKFERTGTQLKGVFTGLMYRIYQRNLSLEENFSSLSVNQNECSRIQLFKRKNSHFKAPIGSVPMILVGPGTGIAPFIGFLEHRNHFKKTSVMPIGETYMFFGCRSPHIDHIYEEDMKKFLNNGVISKLCVCYSRFEESADQLNLKYVQDLIVHHSKEIYKLILNRNAMVFVCGDVKMMSVNICNAFVKVFEEEGNQNHEDAVKTVRDLQAAKRYLQDVWT